MCVKCQKYHIELAKLDKTNIIFTCSPNVGNFKVFEVIVKGFFLR